MGSATPATTDATFTADVLESGVPVLVDFWAEWCGPCKMVGPVLEEIATAHAGKIKIVKLNIDENPEVTRQYQIMSIPTMSVFVKAALTRRPPRWPRGRLVRSGIRRALTTSPARTHPDRTDPAGLPPRRPRP